MTRQTQKIKTELTIEYILVEFMLNKLQQGQREISVRYVKSMQSGGVEKSDMVLLI